MPVIYPAAYSAASNSTIGWTISATVPVPARQTALDWLDAEIEKTCALARRVT